MNFGAAVSTCFSKYVVFSGRARRSEYWWFFLLYAVVYLAAVIVDAALNVPIFAIVVALALFLPVLAVSIRRLHDTGRRGWWFVFGLIPVIGTITLIVFYCQDSDFDNEYGPSPQGLPTHPW